MRRRLLALALYAAMAASDAWAQPDPAFFPATPTVVAIGDVHGAYDALVQTLRAARVIDTRDRWMAGSSHLVSVGDLVDRGPGSRQVLDLLMRLQPEAEAAGGRVHVLLGNHEHMNLLGELRDLAPGEIAAFAPDETSAERDAAFMAWRTRQAAAADEAQARATFDARFPAGWFARRRAFAPDGHYGAWLLRRPVAAVVGDTLFVHGGTSSVLADQPLESINRRFADRLGTQLGDIATLEAAGWLVFEQAGETRPEILAARLGDLPPDADPALVEAARRVIAYEAEALAGIRGPMWYRGLALCRSVLEQDVVDAALARHRVARVAMGHTVTPRRQPTLRLGQRALLLDSGMLRSVYGGAGHAVIINADGVSVVRQDGLRLPAVIDDSPVLPAAPGGDEAIFAQRLASATAVAAPSDGHKGREALTLDIGGANLAAWWFPIEGREARSRELAAFQLDRLLGLGLVPTTVALTRDGVPGALQWRPTPQVSAADAARGVRAGTPWCDATAQIELLYVWDALTGNEARTESTLAWSADDWLLLASDHRAAFGSGKRLPRWLEGRPLVAGPELCRRLGTLDGPGLESALGEQLSKRERAAVLNRRDRIVKLAGCAKPD